MTWLGLGPDAEYEHGGEVQAGAFSDPAMRAEPSNVGTPRVGAAPRAGGAASSGVAPRAGGTGPVSPMSEHGHNDFSAVRSLGPMTEGEGTNPGPRPDAAPLSNTSLRPVDVTQAEEPPMGSVQAVPASVGSKPQLVAPRSFNDAQEVADRFRGGAPVILNLQETDAELGRRLIDFCSGLCYGLRGQMQRVGDRVFLVIPADVQLSAEDHRLIRESGLLS